MRFHCGFAVPYHTVHLRSVDHPGPFEIYFFLLFFFFFLFSFFFPSFTSDAINIYIGQVSGFTVRAPYFSDNTDRPRSNARDSTLQRFQVLLLFARIAPRAPGGGSPCEFHRVDTGWNFEINRMELLTP